MDKNPRYLLDDEKRDNRYCEKTMRLLDRQKPADTTNLTMADMLGFITTAIQKWTLPSVPEFHPFSRLPRELQIKIWKAALPKPANIKLSLSQIHGQKFVFRSTAAKNRYALRRTCTLSREVTLEHFSIRFETGEHAVLYLDEADIVEWDISLRRSLHGFHISIGMYLEHLGLALDRKIDGTWVFGSLLDFGGVRVNRQLFKEYRECMHQRSGSRFF